MKLLAVNAIFMGVQCRRNGLKNIPGLLFAWGALAAATALGGTVGGLLG